MRYEQHHLEWLRQHRPKLEQQTLAAEFNRTFDTLVSVRNLANVCRYYGIRSSNSGRFDKGHTPINKRPVETMTSIAEHAEKLGIDSKTLSVAAEKQRLKPVEKTKTNKHLYRVSALNAAWQSHLDSKAENQHWTTPAHTNRQAAQCRLFRQVDQAITQAMRPA